MKSRIVMLKQSICHVYIIHFQKSVTNFTDIMKMNLTDNLHSKMYPTHELRQQKNNVINYKLDVHKSMHHNINLIERTNKMQPCGRIYYSNVS